MREAVSDIIAERAQMTDGISRMVMLSLVAHGVLVTALVLKPELWRAGARPEPEPMMISIGGAEGPKTGGVNPLSAKPVQEVAPPEVTPRVQPQPAPKPPEMTVPEPLAKPAPRTPAKPIEKPADKTTTRKPTTGAEVKTGSAVAETGSTAQVPFGGLSSGGGGSGGVKLDVANFCCPSYIDTVVNLIKRNWSQNQGAAGMNTVKFVIHRNGLITDIEVEEPAGQLLDMASRRALVITKTVPPLPREFSGDKLTIHLIFEYKR